MTGELTRIKRFPSGWSIAELHTEDGHFISLVGDMPSVTEGMKIHAKVKEDIHPQYGQRYVVQSVEEAGFGNAEGIIRYLAGEDFFNIGVVTARAIVEYFGMEALNILDEDVERVREVPNISANRKQQIIDSWNGAREEHRALATLINLGMMPTVARKVHRHFKSLAVKMIQENPYRMTDVPGIGFVTADDVALKMGVPRDSVNRICAGIQYAMSEALAQGHCYMYLPDLNRLTIELLRNEVEHKKFLEAMDTLKGRNTLTLEGDRIYLTHIYNAEREVADQLKAILSYEAKPLYHSVEEMMQDLDKLDILPEGQELAAEQKEALFMAANTRASIITGGPGTGKSTITKALIAIFNEHGIRYELCSPTGMAAKRLSNATGQDARTIHRMLEFSPIEGGFLRNMTNPLDADCVTIDEASMVDITLFRHLLEATERNDRVIMVGDADQLPSVGPGNVLRDLIASGVIPTTRLKTIFRQAAGNTIITVAHDILNGKVPDLPTPKNRGDKNCMFVGANELDTLREYVVTLVQKTLPALGYSADQIQVLTPMRGKGAGVEDLNPLLQAVLNPPHANKPEVSLQYRLLRVGDRVMQIRNDYDKMVFNGEVGKIAAITSGTDNTNVKIFVQYPDLPSPVEYAREEWDDIQLAYACTIHKSQGSEYPAVVMVLHHSQWVMLQRNLFYTGLTRAKNHCIIVGTNSAIQRAVENSTEKKRNTTLKQLMKS